MAQKRFEGDGMIIPCFPWEGCDDEVDTIDYDPTMELFFPIKGIPENSQLAPFARGLYLILLKLMWLLDTHIESEERDRYEKEIRPQIIAELHKARGGE